MFQRCHLLLIAGVSADCGVPWLCCRRAAAAWTAATAAPTPTAAAHSERNDAGYKRPLHPRSVC